jgi:hypothetical protein
MSPPALRVAAGRGFRARLPGNEEIESRAVFRTSSPPGLTRWSMLSAGTKNVASAHDILPSACVPSVWIAGSSPPMTKERLVSLPSPRQRWVTPKPVPRVVTTGLDPVVHAERRHGETLPSAHHILPKIAPVWIHRTNQINTLARPMFDVLFTLNRCYCRRMLLVIDQHFDAVPFGEALNKSFPVFVDAADQIIRDADVEGAAGSACKDIDPKTFHAFRQHGLPGQARQ